MLVLLIHRSGSSSSSDGAEAEAGFPPASSSSSILVYGAYLAVLVLLVLLFVLVILCRKRRDDATPASSLIPTLDLHSSKLWIGPTNPTSPSPFPPSPPPYSQPSPQQLQLISRHNHLLLLLASNFCRSLPWDCGLVQGLADIGHRSRRYYAEISDAKVDAEMGGGAAVQCMMCVVDVSGLDVVDYSGLKRFSQMRSLLLSLQHPNVLPVYNAHWLPAAASSSSSSPTSFSSSSVAVAAPSASPHCIFVTPLSPHGSLRDHLTSALCSHPYATKYFTAASQHRRGSPLPLRHVRAFTRQLISGLLYLRSRGIVMYHLHSGNVLLMREEGGRGVRCLLAGVEGVLLGLKGRLHRKVKRLRHVDPVLSSLALLVYEMCTGVEARGQGESRRSGRRGRRRAGSERADAHRQPRVRRRGRLHRADPARRSHRDAGGAAVPPAVQPAEQHVAFAAASAFAAVRFV